MNNNADKLGFKCIFTTLKAGFLKKTHLYMLNKAATILWQYCDVKLFEEKVQREYHSNREGLSIRIAKGIYYRPSYRTNETSGTQLYEPRRDRRPVYHQQAPLLQYQLNNIFHMLSVGEHVNRLYSAN